MKNKHLKLLQASHPETKNVAEKTVNQIDKVIKKLADVTEKLKQLANDHEKVRLK